MGVNRNPEVETVRRLRLMCTRLLRRIEHKVFIPDPDLYVTEQTRGALVDAMVHVLDEFGLLTAGRDLERCIPEFDGRHVAREEVCH